MTFEEEAIQLSKAVILLDKYKFIQTYDETEEAHCEHLQRIALCHANNIRNLYLAAKGTAPYVDHSADTKL